MSSLSKHVYTPLETGNAGYNEAKRIKEAVGTGINAPEIAGTDFHKYFARVMPWEIVMIIGQTHNGKTLFSDWWEDGICKQLNKENRKDEVVVHVSLEESLEAMSFQQHSKYSKIPVKDIASGEADLEKLKLSLNVIAGVNIYRIADSAQSDYDAPPLTLSNIFRIVSDLKSGNVTGSEVKIAAIWIDYLQALPFDEEVIRHGGEAKRRLQVREDVYRMRKMTTHIGAPIFCNSQAKQDLPLSKAPFYIPGIYDGSEAKEIGDRPDRSIGIYMPKVNYYRIGEDVKELGVVTEDMFYVKVNKQRGGFPSGKTFPCKWNFENRTLSSLYGVPNGQR